MTEDRKLTPDEWHAKHQAAFRVAYDTLKALWPPRNDVEWFSKTAYPVCAVAHEDKLKDNPLGQRFIEVLYWYLGDMVAEMDGQDA